MSKDHGVVDNEIADAAMDEVVHLGGKWVRTRCLPTGNLYELTYIGTADTCTVKHKLPPHSTTVAVLTSLLDLHKNLVVADCSSRGSALVHDIASNA